MKQPQTKTRTAAWHLLTAAVLFGCFALMYFFMVPQLDMFVFAKACGGSLGEIWSEAVNYGNGRLLGNLLGFVFAHHFAFAFLPAALCMTGVVLCCTKLALRGKPLAAWIPAVVFAFPAMKLTQDVYGVFAAFINYVFPLFFAGLAVCLLQRLSRGKFRPPHLAALPVLFLCAVSSALFSENTTIVLCVLSVLWLLNEKLRTKKVRAPSVVYLLGTLCGSVCMLLLPKLTGTADKMNDYRSALSIRAAFGGVLRTAAVVHSFFLPLLLFSVGLLLLLRKAADTRAVRFARTVFAVYPFLTLLLSIGDLLQPFSRALQTLHLLPATLFAVACVIALRALRDKGRRRNLLHLYVLLLSSVVPMLFVSQYGYRTYYITFALLTVGGLVLVREEAAFVKKKIAETHLRLQPPAVALACVFVVLSGVFAMQSAVNFDTFVLRTGQIALAQREGKSDVTVPVLPCKYLSAEEQWPYGVRMVLPDDAALQIRLTADLSLCENADAYRAFYGGSPVYTLRYALENRRYADVPQLFAEFLKN